ncbi:MAG: FAD-dependent oxidoreductase [Candidatus Dadabacteria bacterium]|nr:MAG: FAD-dependent oxidoreductase [Candidatus Dadabacteria bacterium]
MQGGCEMKRLRRRHLIHAGLALPLLPSGSQGAETPFDAVIIGGGISGLVAAWRLQQAGRRVVVCEARPRVGGRTVNLQIAGGEPIEGGGEWIGPQQDAIIALNEELGLKTFPAFYDGDTTYDVLGRVSRGLIPDIGVGDAAGFARVAWKLNRLATAIPRGSSWQAADAAALDRLTLADWLNQQNANPFTHAIFRLATRAILAGYPERISLLWFLHYFGAGGGLLPLMLNDGGAQDQRFEGGSQVLSLTLAERLGSALHLATPVRAIRQRTDHADIVTARGTLRARRVVIAMMPSDIGRIAVEPGWSRARAELIRRWTLLPRLPIVKCALAYSRPFWRDKGLNGAMQSDRAPIQLIFDNSPADGSAGVLSCFLSIAEAPELADRRTRPERLAREVARYFGPEGLEPIDYVEKDWAADPWSTSCLSPLVPGVISEFGPTLRKPEGRIHFAGTETAEAWCGFMDGAVRAGERAAREVNAALRG